EPFREGTAARPRRSSGDVERRVGDGHGHFGFCRRRPVLRRSSPGKNNVSRLIDLVEDTAVGEMRLLGFLPATEELVDREQFHLLELAGVFGSGLFRAGTI